MVVQFDLYIDSYRFTIEHSGTCILTCEVKEEFSLSGNGEIMSGWIEFTIAWLGTYLFYL
jgi:hypothetical protein